MDGMTKAEVDRIERSTIAHSDQPIRPRDAATLILLDRKGDEVLVLMGRRHAGHAFMPGKFVFPGGRTDPADSRIPVATALHPERRSQADRRSRPHKPGARPRHRACRRSARPMRKPAC